MPSKQHNMVTVRLTNEEYQIILTQRAEQEHIEKTDAFREKALNTANDFFKWLSQKERGPSFSTFVNEFGYDEPDCKLMYEAVKKVLDLVHTLKITY